MSKKHGGKVQPVEQNNANEIRNEYVNGLGQTVVDVERSLGNSIYLSRECDGKLTADCFAYGDGSEEFRKAAKKDFENITQASYLYSKSGQIDTDALFEKSDSAFKDTNASDHMAQAYNIYDASNGRPVFQTSILKGENGTNALMTMHSNTEFGNVDASTRIYAPHKPDLMQVFDQQLIQREDDGNPRVLQQLTMVGYDGSKATDKVRDFIIDTKTGETTSMSGDTPDYDSMDAYRKDHPMPEGCPINIDAPIPDVIHTYRIDEAGTLSAHTFTKHDDGSYTSAPDGRDWSNFDQLMEARIATVGYPRGERNAPSASQQRGNEFDDIVKPTDEEISLD